MKEIRVQFIESDVEHVIAGQTLCKQGEHHIEIITNGSQKLVFIDGKRLHRVLDIDVPLTAGELSPAITIKLHPDKITVRNVDGPQFKSLTRYAREHGSGGAADSGPGSVGHAAVELDRETASRVLDLRESVELDAEKLRYLQRYAESCWRARDQVAE